jgi:hypothetical protein
MDTKSYMLNFAYIIKDLNLKRNNKSKLKRIDIIIDWLKNLNSFPTMEEKLNLIQAVKVASIKI